MKTLQPNFETLKTLFYRTFVDSADANTAVLFETIVGKNFPPSFHVREDSFKKDFNSWLNRLDIRCAVNLINVLNENEALIKANGLSFPSWLKNKNYAIEYNDRDMLDLINLS